MRVCTSLLVLLIGQAFGQTVTTLNLSTQGHNPDFSNFPFTRPVSVGSALPATCQMGQLFFSTAAAAGQNMYACTQTNTWAVVGGYTLLPAGTNALGGVVIPNNSALAVDGNGVLSANIGTTAGTLAAGNDTRIVNALQPTSQIPASNVTGLARSATTDTTNASNIATGTLSASLFPSTINSNTSGNAATASSLTATPSGCAVNQYALGILANGTARCAQVAYGQVSGAPTLYNQHVQVGGSAQTQRVNVNFAAGSNVNIAASDNGSNTTTLTISGTGLQAPTTANSLVKFTSGTATAAAQASDVISALGFTPQNASGLNAPSGYAGLDSNGLLLATEMPATINSNTNGKAATATALAATPTGCPGGQFATGIGVNGNAICGTATGTGGLPDPGSNGLVKRTSANADAVAIAGTDYYAPGTPISDADLPNIITSSITGNAGSATALAATPAVCTGGQFATGIGVSGNAICGTPTGAGGLPDPGSNGLVKRTSANADAVAIAGTDYYAPGTPIRDADLPNTITSSITGNAATATALTATPTPCPGGQFATGIGANGNATCGTPSSGGSGVATGTSLPAASTCGSSNLGNLYSQTMPSPSSGGQNRRFFVCQQNGTAYAWWPITDGRVNVMGFGCKADGSTDDQPCFQAAVNFAGVLNKYSNWDQGSSYPYLGAEVFVPCGDYAIGSPIVLPRVNQVSYPNGPNNGVVGLIGESPTCSVLYGLTSSGFNGVTGVYVTNPGSGYTSAPSASFSGGCTTEPVTATLLQPGTTNLASVYITTPASGCTSMPTCTISGGGGTGATCEAVGRAIVEWATTAIGTFLRTPWQRIKNLRFRSPSVAGSMAIHYATQNAPNDSACAIGGGTVCDRMEQADFENLNIEDDNVYNPASIYIGADCNTCSFKYLSNDPHLASSGGYQTPLIATNFWASATQNEGDGFQYGEVDNLGCGGSKNGSAPCFQGRLQRASMTNTFCDGIRIGADNATCYAFYNSTNVNLTNIGNEGNGGIQVLIQNSRHFVVTNLGIGTPIASSTDPPLGGLYLIGSSQNRFVGHMAGSSFASSGLYRISVDSRSFQNEFFDYEINGTNEISISNTGSNFMQYCIVGSTCGTNQNWSTLGTASY